MYGMTKHAVRVLPHAETHAACADWPLWHVPAQIVSLSESLHQELAGTDVHVHLVCPGFVNTKFLEPALSLIPADLHKEARIVRRAMPCRTMLAWPAFLPVQSAAHERLWRAGH